MFFILTYLGKPLQNVTMYITTVHKKKIYNMIFVFKWKSKITLVSDLPCIQGKFPSLSGEIPAGKSSSNHYRIPKSFLVL